MKDISPQRDTKNSRDDQRQNPCKVNMLSGVEDNAEQTAHTGEHNDDHDQFWFQKKSQRRTSEQGSTKARHSLDGAGR